MSDKPEPTKTEDVDMEDVEDVDDEFNDEPSAASNGPGVHASATEGADSAGAESTGVLLQAAACPSCLSSLVKTRPSRRC